MKGEADRQTVAALAAGVGERLQARVTEAAAAKEEQAHATPGRPVSDGPGGGEGVEGVASVQAASAPNAAERTKVAEAEFLAALDDL